jgi:lipid II:glycine glycyltransferase (peptidoglycan interpeptide bridge formation enzyme)
MKLFYFTGREQLNDFIKTAFEVDGAEFLQSWEWGDILEIEGKEILRVGVIDDNNQILAAATLVKTPLGLNLIGSAVNYFYWYAPRGPIFNGKSPAANCELEKFLLSEIKKIDRRAIFLRIEPKGIPADGLGLPLKKTLDLQPRKTLILDLTPDEEELLSAMNQKTRYNIRLAEKKGVEIVAGAKADFSEFWRLMSLTGDRDNFRLHHSEHYQKLIDSDPDGGFIKLFFARYQNRNIAAGLFCFYGGRATYLHGASDNEFRNVMAPYLLQWFVIKMAKKTGCNYYDFCGIDEKKWPGVTRFKLGFGGRQVEYPGTFDVVFRSTAYYLYNFSRRVIRKLRNILSK